MATVRTILKAAVCILTALILGALLTSYIIREPAPPPSGEELWQSLPCELLADVAEGIMERISEQQDDLARVWAIYFEKATMR